MLTCVDLCSSVQNEAERYRCIERCVSIVKGGPAPPSPPSCMPADAVYELNDFIAAYRRAPKGFEDWQIALQIANVIASAIKRCEIDELSLLGTSRSRCGESRRPDKAALAVSTTFLNSAATSPLLGPETKRRAHSIYFSISLGVSPAFLQQFSHIPGSWAGYLRN